MIGVIVAMVVAGAFSLIVYRNYNVYIRYSDAPPPIQTSLSNHGSGWKRYFRNSARRAYQLHYLFIPPLGQQNGLFAPQTYPLAKGPST
jgi:hypothetical protein